ncbi:SRPBCC family protein [Catelliglobosispora koreensis]|uniref:SRPBCC family protein n=1 Tax=Catelliglobosispora koreensis TaxID=129052 RepID=UPI000374DAA2|nr:SRPBCC family protein [Catelliglobosispora koreensis]
MGSVIVSVEINQERRKVFAYATDPRNYPHWWKGTRAIRILSGPPWGGVGTVYQADTTLLGVSVLGRIEITEYREGESMTAVTIRSLTPFTARYRFEPIAGGAGTRMTLDAEVTGDGTFRAFGPLFLPLLRAATSRHLGTLKSILER